MHIKKLLILSLWIASNIFCNQKLLYATNDQDLKEVKRILAKDSKVQIDFQGLRGDTPLMQTGVNNNLDIAKLLIANGAKLNVRNDEGTTALIFACKNNSIDVARLLIQHGANLDERDNDNYTALMWACIMQYLDITKLLITHGADLNLQKTDGYTALMMACMQKNLHLMSLLVLAGADEPTDRDTYLKKLFNHPMVIFARNLRQWILADDADQTKIPNHENIAKAFLTVAKASREALLISAISEDRSPILLIELNLMLNQSELSFEINHFDEIYKEYQKLTGP